MSPEEILEIRQKLKDDFQHYASRCLKIRSKSGEIIPFMFNRAQLYAHAKLEEQLQKLRRVRALICKGRQQGMSTYIGGRYYHKVTHRFGAQAFILTHALDATQNLYKMAHRYHEHCPPIVRPEVSTSNAKELVFGKLESGYKVGTAENKSVGRSSTIQFFHGCLAEGTKIYDPITCNLYNIEDYIVGQNVLTHNGNIAPVSFISNQEKECQEIILRSLTAFPLLATEEHRFFTKRGWVKLKDFKSDDCIGYPIKEITGEISSINLPEAPVRAHGGGRQSLVPDTIEFNYAFGLFVGLYLAEGHIKLQAKEPYNPSSISFTVHRKEVQRTMEWVTPFHEYYSSLHIQHRENSLTSIITLYGNRLAALMNEICGRTICKRINGDWHKTPKEFLRGLLHGYISGDGHSDDQCRRIRASSICSAITFPLREIAASLGYGWASIELKEAGIRHGRNEKERFTFSLCGDGASKLANEIGKITPQIVNKKTKSTKLFAASTIEISDGYAWLRIKSINNAGMRQVYDFEIAHEDHSYCTIHGATHNSEVGFWANTDEHSKGIIQAIPDADGTESILESTANGVGNYFHQMWQNAEAGLTDYIPIFVPWFWQDEYVKSIPHADFQPEDNETDLMELYGLSIEQIIWRRAKIIDLSVNGQDGEKAFKQEYPCNPNEAFQLTGEDTYISSDLVMRARKTIASKYGRLVLGVDPARFGDDRTAIIRRQGRVSYGIESHIKKDTMEVTGIVAKIIDKEQPFKVFVDVGGLGAGIVDRLNELGFRDIVVPVNAGGKPLDAERYKNKRAEMWGNVKEYLENEPCQIPDSNELHADLCGVKYKFNSSSQLVMEPKEDMKKRGIRSSDCADALCLTFAYPESALQENSVRKNEIAANIMSKQKHSKDLRKQHGRNRR